MTLQTLNDTPPQPQQTSDTCARQVVPLAFLYRISREISAGIELRPVLQRILSLSMENVGATSASIIVLDDNLEPIDSIIIYNDRIHNNTTGQLRPTLEHGLAGWVLQHHQAVLIPDTSHDQRWLQRPDDQQNATGAKSAVSALLTAREQPVGVMTLVHPHPNSFTEQHLELVQAIADQAGIAVLNARLYAESRRQYKELQTAHQRYRELQENLTAMVYHDMRSPLANVTNSLELLRSLLSENVDETIASVLSIAERGANRIQRLTNSLLDISRLESGQPIIHRKTVDPLGILHEAMEIVLPTIKERGQPLETDLPACLPLIFVERDMILRVLINLLENASKYSHNNKPIYIGASVLEQNGHEWVMFSVKDSGLGIPSEDLEYIFQKFARSSYHRDKVRGIGLGLTFCRLAVEGHGGTIWAESQVNEGSQFFFTLPVKQDA